VTCTMTGASAISILLLPPSTGSSQETIAEQDDCHPPTPPHLVNPHTRRIKKSAADCSGNAVDAWCWPGGTVWAGGAVTRVNRPLAGLMFFRRSGRRGGARWRRGGLVVVDGRLLAAGAASGGDSDHRDRPSRSTRNQPTTQAIRSIIISCVATVAVAVNPEAQSVPVAPSTGVNGCHIQVEVFLCR
jgi:hypothetical protein